MPLLLLAGPRALQGHTSVTLNALKKKKKSKNVPMLIDLSKPPAIDVPSSAQGSAVKEPAHRRRLCRSARGVQGPSFGPFSVALC